jgi:protocatechuate 3,4-dioxygenase beta subunit
MSSHEHDLGLEHDLPILLSRRRAITLLGGAGLSAALAACGGSSGSSTSATTAAASNSSQEIPEETAGPYPADGSNGINALTQSGIVRSDITQSFGDASGSAPGVPLTIRLRVLDVAAGSAPLEGAAVYLWHCNQSGQYSLYDPAVSDQNYLRGVQPAGADGWVTFTSIYPAAYSGRWPHIHFEVYPSLDEATSAGSKLRTSQMALPEETSRAVYETDGYSGSLDNLAQTSLATDLVFSDGYSLQMATVTGSAAGGLTATLTVPV